MKQALWAGIRAAINSTIDTTTVIERYLKLLS